MSYVASEDREWGNFAEGGRDAYREEMSRLGVFGGDLEIRAAEEMYKLRIVVLAQEEHVSHSLSQSKSVVVLLHYAKHFDLLWPKACPTPAFTGPPPYCPPEGSWEALVRRPAVRAPPGGAGEGAGRADSEGFIEQRSRKRTPKGAELGTPTTAPGTS